MNLIELDRDFVTLDPTRSYSAEIIATFRGSTWHGLKWPDLLKHRRVVVLAEAASGKTAEFSHKAAALRGDGAFGIYLPIERLARNGLSDSLSLDERRAYDDWFRGADPGWFFLDSIDEARIHHKDIESALNRFARELGDAYDRASVLLSCRGTAWEGESDLKLIERTVPVRMAPPADEPEIDPDDALLKKPERVMPEPRKVTAAERAVQLVTLGKISKGQRAVFLAAEKVMDADRFEGALFRHGLEGLAERPGDLRTLIRFWRTHSEFAGLTEMVEFGINERLAETNQNRLDTIGFSPAEAREGAERLAAAMTLGRTMDLLLPNIADASAAGINPYEVLNDWNARDVDGLLHRAIFAPSSFGRIRFYHRSAQEYLTASWIERLQPTDAELYRIFLAEAFGVRTVPPSLRAAAAWIAGRHTGLREQILEREPQLLLSEGDPRILSIVERAKLLVNFAKVQLAGDNSYRLVDHRSLWMFADNALAPAIREALSANPRADFRFEMLRLIEEGKISECRDVVLETALDRGAADYHRIVAMQALAEQEDEDALTSIAQNILSGPPPSATLAPSAALALFPKALTVEQLLQLIAMSKPARRFQVEGFREELLGLYERCSTDEDRLKLISGLALLAFEPPLDEWPRISKRHATLVAMFAPTAREAIRVAQRSRITPELLSFLRATQRVSDELPDEGLPVAELVRSWRELNEALFWADADAQSESSGKPVTRYHEVSPDGPTLWGLSAADRPWLFAALGDANSARRLLGLDALIALAYSGEHALAELEALREQVSGDSELVARVTEALTPRTPTPQDLERKKKWAAIEEAREKREENARQYWRRLRDTIQVHPEELCDPVKLRRWPGPRPLLQLTQWLAERVSGGLSAAALHSKLLDRAFGDEVAMAYRQGMRTLWRVTKPERPKEDADGRRTVKYTILLSMAGLGLEASERPDWASSLSEDEARRATSHACLDDQGAPEWLGALLAVHPATAGPIISNAIAREWRGDSNYTPLLERAAHSLAPIEPTKPALQKLLLGPEPKKIERVATASDLVLRLNLAQEERRAIARLALRRLRRARAAGDFERMSAHLRLFFRIDPEAAARALIAITESALADGNVDEVQRLLKATFHRHRDPAVHASALPVKHLLRLTEIAYLLRAAQASAKPQRRKPSEMDEDQEQSRLRDAFDDPLNELLSGLLNVGGEEAYVALISLAKNPAVGESSHRLRELAREVAERSAERPQWREAQVRNFEQKKLAPIVTGDDLLDLACDLLDRIDWDFHKADMSPRSVVQPAESEKQIQEWLGSMLRVLGMERFSVARESVVADDNRPDLVLVAARSPVEVAVEIKHGERKWSFKALLHALKVQLAEQYLLPHNRRHGVLVITNHRAGRVWRLPDRRSVDFGELISLLQAEATKLAFNSAGAIRVEVRGLDASR